MSACRVRAVAAGVRLEEGDRRTVMGRRVLVRQYIRIWHAGRPNRTRASSGALRLASRRTPLRCASRRSDGVSLATSNRPGRHVFPLRSSRRAARAACLIRAARPLRRRCAAARFHRRRRPRHDSNGRAVRAPSSVVHRAVAATSTVSASDGRYVLTVARAGRRDRVTLLARRIGYEPWQRCPSISRATPCASTSRSPRPRRRSRRW